MMLASKVTESVSRHGPSPRRSPLGGAYNRAHVGAYLLKRHHHQRGSQQPAAASTALALVLGFLPWNGCSVGGFYDTGVQGTAGKDCQAMYQPAAAAESRFAAAQRASATTRTSPITTAATPADTTTSTTATSTTATSGNTDQPIAQQEDSSRPKLEATATSSAATATSAAATATSAAAASAAASAPAEPAAVTVSVQLAGGGSTNLPSSSEQLGQVPEAVKDLIRDILGEDNKQRTKELVDAAWQTLE